MVVSPRSDRALSDFGVVQGPRRVRDAKAKAKAREGKRDRMVFVTRNERLEDDGMREAGRKLFYDCMAQVSSLG